MIHSTKTIELCQQMNEVRSNLDEGVGEIVESAQTLTDWRHYVKAHPWACLGAAAAVGFMLVPKRVVVVSPSAEVLDELTKKNKVVVQTPRPTPTAAITGLVTGLGGTLLRLAASYAAREGMSYISKHGMHFFQQPSAEETSHAESNP